jgi:hypothetical protein
MKNLILAVFAALSLTAAIAPVANAASYDRWGCTGYTVAADRLE